MSFRHYGRLFKSYGAVTTSLLLLRFTIVIGTKVVPFIHTILKISTLNMHAYKLGRLTIHATEKKQKKPASSKWHLFKFMRIFFSRKPFKSD